MGRNDANSAYWKAKFIDGLPKLFAERVRIELQDDKAPINFDNYTYGQLIVVKIKEGLKLCNDFKLQKEIEKQNRSSRKELGQFCYQFAVDIPSAYNSNKYHKRDKY